MKLIQLAVAGLVLAVSTPSFAIDGPGHEEGGPIFFSSNGGAVCKPANGADIGNWAYGAAGLRNISNSTQNLICNLPLLRGTQPAFLIDGSTGYQATLLFGGATAGSTVTCVATVLYAGQSVATRSTSTKSVVLAANGGGGINYSRTDLAIKDYFAPVNLSCSIPAGVLFGRLDLYAPL